MSKAEATKAFIIEKTAPIFNKKGYSGTSLTDLTTATGLTKGALYGNFKNKDEIALAAFEHNFKLVRSTFMGTAGSNPLQRLLSIPQLVKVNFQPIAAQGGCPILNTATEADDNHPLLKKRVTRVIDDWKENLSTTIKDGKDMGLVRKDANPEKYAQLIIALLEGGIMLAKVSGKKAYLEVTGDQITKIINEELKK